MSNAILEVERLMLRLRKLWEEKRNTSRQVYFEHRVSEYREMWGAMAHHLGGTFHALAEDIWELDLGDQVIRINNHQLELDNPVTLALAGKKPLVHRLLKQQGIAVPDYTVFQRTDLSAAYQFLGRYQNGCVIKPADGYGGKGVTTHIQTRYECRKAAILASLYSKDLLMEPQIPGESYRVLVIEGKVASIVRRRGVSLVGDGKRTVIDLMRSENDRRREQRRGLLAIDRDSRLHLKYYGLSPESIPDRGVCFMVKSVDEASKHMVEVRTVYNEDATDLVCDSIKHDAELAAKIIRSDFLGVDVITTDASCPLKQSGGVINEVNTTPALHHHYDVSKESYPLVGLTAVAALVRKQCAARGTR
jgi:D-alanine-D-alanine ligase-like ATP-grasp enzyme